jgi:RNA polymerase sigma factor (sigma-70 family)
MIQEEIAPHNGNAKLEHSLEELQTALKRYCLFLTQSTWDAEDLAQDTWVKAWGTLTSMQHPNPEAFIMRVAKNTWVDRTRRKAVWKRIFLEEQPKIIMPENSLLDIELALQALIKHMSPLQRAVFLLRDVFEYSIEETAGLLETTEGAVKAALHRSRLSLVAVREELERGELTDPEEDNMRCFLRAIASAYQVGDVPTLLAIMQLEPNAAIGFIHNKLLLKSRSTRLGDSLSMLQMAA